jgi:hypothetical protein
VARRFALARLLFFAASLTVVHASLRELARADDATSLTVRDNVYTFASPGNAVGPWYALKLDVDHAFPRDELLLRVANGFHDQAKPEHGEFVRLEEYHRLSPAILVKVAGGLGSGYQPIRSSVAEVSAAVPGVRGVALALGEVVTTNHNESFQRIVALGPDVACGAFVANLRYYHATLSTGVVAPPSYEMLAGMRLAKRATLGAIVDLGGEVGGDRTASQLPTSSGLYGPAYGLSGSYGAGPLRIVAAYQEGDYRSARTGALAYRQYVTTFGVAAAVGR